MKVFDAKLREKFDQEISQSCCEEIFDIFDPMLQPQTPSLAKGVRLANFSGADSIKVHLKFSHELQTKTLMQFMAKFVSDFNRTYFTDF